MAIIKAVEDGKISRPNSKALFEIIVQKTLAGENVAALDVAKDAGMLGGFDDAALENAINEVLAEFADAMKDFEKSPDKVIRFYMGKVMQKSKGLANPQRTLEAISNKLNK